MKKTLFTGFSPNTTKRDVRISLSFLLLPWKWTTWRQGIHTIQAEHALESYFRGYTATTFDSGRSALYIALQTLGVKEGDEVLVQAYTCVVVINAIRWTGATPIYVDIDPDTLNMDPQDARQKVTDKTKVLLLQHTFGLPADITGLMQVAKDSGLRTIEDCAHSLGARYNGQLTGTFADIGMLSFGGEKIISCVRGGALITKDTHLTKKIREHQRTLPFASLFSITQHLLHVIYFPLGKKWYHLFIGKVLLKLVKEFHLTNNIISTDEKKGERPRQYPSRLPNALAALLVQQLQTIHTKNEHRQHIASIYKAHIPTKLGYQSANPTHIYLRYTIFSNDAQKILQKAKKEGILLGNWYQNIIDPTDIDMKITGYTSGACPNAEKRAAQSVNLPTNIHISEQDALRIVHMLSE